MKNNNLVPFRETAIIALGEAIVSGIIIAVFLAIGKYNYTVALGALLGSAVIILNFFFLSFFTNRAIDKIMALRPEGDMDEEQIAKFTQENAVKIQNTAKISYVIRTFTMLAAFIAALISGVFNVISTVIPLLMLRPIIYVAELFRRKKTSGAIPAFADGTEAALSDAAEGAGSEESSEEVGDATLPDAAEGAKGEESSDEGGEEEAAADVSYHDTGESITEGK